MKYSIILLLFVLLTWRCGRIETIANLQTEQKSLRDSANHINARIGEYLNKGVDDSAAIQQIQLGKVRDRLICIQTSIDEFNIK